MVKHLASQVIQWFHRDQNTENFLYWTGTGTAFSWAAFHEVSQFCKEVMPILSVTATVLYILKMIYDTYKSRKTNKPPHS